MHEWVLDDEGLAALLRSLSHVGPALGPARLEALLEDARRLAQSVGEARWSRELALTWVTRHATPA